MSAMKDYFTEIEEEIEKWYPFLSWDTIGDIVWEGGFIAKEAQAVVDQRRGYEKSKRNHQNQ